MNLEPLRTADLDESELAERGQHIDAMEQLASLAASALRVPMVLMALPGSPNERACIVAGTGEIPRWSAADEAALWRSGLVELVSAGPFEMRDMTRNYPLDQLRIFAQLRLGSLLGVPVRSTSDHVYGVICAAYSTPTSWNDDDRAMLQQFAQLAAADHELRRRVDEHAENEARLRFNADHDALTGLATRGALLERLRDALERPPRPVAELRGSSDHVLAPPAEDLVAVFRVDVENFSAVNARFGHQVGDQVLTAAGRRLSRAAGRDALVARMGGDQFAAVVERLETMDAVQRMSEQLREACEQPMLVGTERVSLRTRVGVSSSATTAMLAEHLLFRADVAVGRATPPPAAILAPEHDVQPTTTIGAEAAGEALAESAPIEVVESMAVDVAESMPVKAAASTRVEIADAIPAHGATSRSASTSRRVDMITATMATDVRPPVLVVAERSPPTERVIAPVVTVEASALRGANAARVLPPPAHLSPIGARPKATTSMPLADLRRRRSTAGLFRRIAQTVRSWTSLVRNAIEFAKLDTGELRLHVDDVEVATLLEELKHDVVTQTYLKGLHYHPSTCARDIIVRADPSKVRRVLQHLLANAIKFTESGGEIAVECETNAQAVRIRVTDTGCGIPATWLAQVFEPYVQVDAHHLPPGQRGLGLGLAISQRLAVAMGGELEAESDVGSGSSFTLTLLRG